MLLTHADFYVEWDAGDLQLKMRDAVCAWLTDFMCVASLNYKIFSLESDEGGMHWRTFITAHWIII